MSKKAGMTRPVMRYSEAFKLQVLRELETGRWESREAAARAYGLSGHATITYWVRKYGKAHSMGKVIRVEQPEERDEKRELRKRVRELEKALTDAHLEHRFDEAYLPIACQAAGIEDVGEFKKNTLGSGKSRGGRGSQGGGDPGGRAVRACGDEPAELLCGAAFASAPGGG